MQIQKIFSAVILGAAMLLSSPAQAGVVSDTLGALGRQIVKYGSKVAPKALDDAARQSPTIGRLLRTYGDDAVVGLAAHPNRLAMVEQLGDEAAEAFLKHGRIADKVLVHCPDYEVASALGQMSKDAGQYINICANKHALSRDGYKNMVLLVREGGEEVAEKLSKLSPEKFEHVMLTAQTAGLAVAGGMVLATAAVSDSPMDFLQNLYHLLEWGWEHPVLSALVLVLLISLVAKFPRVAVSVLLWLPRLAWSALKALCLLCRPLWLKLQAKVESR